MTHFTENLLIAIGAWQNGWQEDQNRRAELAEKLRRETESLPVDFRTVDVLCYRKRFIHKGELLDIVLADERAEGPTSWTTDKAFAERFKGRVRLEAVSGAIFCHKPLPNEVILNIAALWKTNSFVSAANAFRDNGGKHADALFNFREAQGEVVMEAPLRGSEIVALTAVSSPFDELCDKGNIPERARDALFKQLVDQNIYLGEPTYTSENGAQNAIANTIRRIHKKLGLS